MQLHLSKGVALSMMVACLFAFTKLGALILISIALDYTFVNGCTFSLDIFSSSTSFCVTCSSIDCYSTPLSSFDFSMFIGSTKVAFGPTCTFELQPLLHLCKNSTTHVPVLYILSYCVQKLYLFIVCFASFTLWWWWWMWWWPYYKWLNVQHSWTLCFSQLFFWFFFLQ